MKPHRTRGESKYMLEEIYFSDLCGSIEKKVIYVEVLKRKIKDNKLLILIHRRHGSMMDNTVFNFHHCGINQRVTIKL